ncbi:MAG: polymer-forming cytoskeletal protein [Dysgonamonadaceae bacterium]|jgi:cytoskeletal protein CcmA (bactofilin family)|nr:polymer-forming cytoskeletal protein [Dysgonamonadaceae bacterium]
MKNKENISSGVTHNTLAVGTFVKGDVKAEEDFRIDGRLEGSIECSGRVIIGQQAEVTGNIECEDCDLYGRVDGNIILNGTVKLKSSSHLTGEIVAKYVEIEIGAFFAGSCKMIN